MALKKYGKYYYGDCQADIHPELLRYSKANEYVAQHFADAVCKCGGKVFRLSLDEDVGAAIRICAACKKKHAIGDSADFMAEAKFGICGCPCGHEKFEITAGVSLYDDSDDVRWIYIGCRCEECGLTATYGDWKNEYTDYRKLLALV